MTTQMSNRGLPVWGALILAIVMVQSGQQVGLAADKPTDKPAEKSLFMRLGGEKAVTAVVDDFIDRTLANPKVNFTRKGTADVWDPTEAHVTHLKKLVVEMVVEVTGGPKKYSGRDMKTTHKGMKITDAEFDAMAGDLKLTLDKFKVPAEEQKELFEIIGSTRKDIVEVKK